MAGLNKQDYVDRAVGVLKENDRGTYTVPTKGLYPFQWNWDSCLTALGQRHFDEDRAWTEIETLFEHQWPDGMVPHIVFHVEDDGYFPGPDVWRTGRPVKTSGITQPAVAGFAVRRLFDARRRPAARRRARPRAAAEDRRLAPLVLREPRSRAARAWSPSSTPGSPAATTRSTGTRPSSACRPTASSPTCAATPSMPTRRTARPRRSTTATSGWCSISAALDWDNSKLHDASPFRIVDPGFNAILIRACADLADLADALGEPELAAANRARAEKGVGGDGAALERARTASISASTASPASSIDSASIGGLLAAFAAVPPGARAAVARTIERLARRTRLHRAVARPGRPALRQQALLARPGLARRQLHDRRRAGAAPARRRSPSGSASRASS